MTRRVLAVESIALLANFDYERPQNNPNSARHGSRTGFEQPTLRRHKRPRPMEVLLHCHDDRNGAANASPFLWLTPVISRPTKEGWLDDIVRHFIL